MSTPLLSPSAIEYAWRELARRAGAPLERGAGGESSLLGLPLRYGRPQDFSPGDPGVYVLPASENAFDAILSRLPEQQSWLPLQRALPPGDETALPGPLPVLFWGEGQSPETAALAELLPGGSLLFRADLLAATVFMLARWEEIDRLALLDRHGRFPASASAAARLGFLDRPVVDEYGLALRAWLRRLRPAWNPERGRFAVRLTHDVDYLRLSPFKAARLALMDVLQRRDLRLALETLAVLPGGEASDPYLQGLLWLASESRQHGLSSTFFFMAARPTRKDTGYLVDTPLARRVFDALLAAGFEIGLHNSYGSSQRFSQLADEKAALERATGRSLASVRAHYLRVGVPHAWRAYQNAGFTRDWSMGYSDQEGFRCGTCRPFAPFDLETGRELTLHEHPLIVMDGTLRGERGQSVEAARQRIEQLASRCRVAEGEFTLLWHNNSLDRQWKPWKAMYAGLLPWLKELEARAA